YLNRTSKRQMKNIETGDTVSGVSTSARDFSTIRDFLFDSMFFVGAILLFGLFTIGGIFVLLTEIPAVDRFLEEKTFFGTFLWRQWHENIDYCNGDFHLFFRKIFI